MNPLPTLDSLPTLDQLGQAASAVSDAVSSAASGAASDGLTSLRFASSPTRIVMSILGLLLIAAGIFGFDRTREVITKSAAAAAAAA